jgi:hypothetical protein
MHIATLSFQRLMLRASSEMKNPREAWKSAVVLQVSAIVLYTVFGIVMCASMRGLPRSGGLEADVDRRCLYVSLQAHAAGPRAL